MPFLTCSTILYTFDNCHMGQCHNILDKLQRSSVIIIHYVKYQKFIKFPCMEILQKRTVTHSNSKNTIRPKFYGNCALPQNFHTRKLGETTVYYAVTIIIIIIINIKGSFFFSLVFIISENPISKFWKKVYVVYLIVQVLGNIYRN